MSEQSFSVPVALKDGTRVQGKIIAAFLTENHWSKAWRLSVSFNDRLIAKESTDCFEALVEIRRELESEGIKLLCYGSCKEVHPSGMSRDMSGGVKAYRLTLGWKPGMNDLVHIFETGPDVIPVSVREQEDFWQAWVKWLKTLGTAR